MKLVIRPAIDERRLQMLRAISGELEVVNCASLQEASDEIVDADAFYGKITPELLSRAAQLRWIQSPTASLEHYLFPALIQHPCQLTNMRGLFDDVIADHVMAYVLVFARRFHVYLAQQRASHWEPLGGEAARADFAAGPGVVNAIDRAHMHLADCTLGVIGVGRIGAEICRRAAGFGMRLMGVDPIIRRVEGLDLDVQPVGELSRLLSEADFVVVACPHTPETVGMIGREELARMKPASYLINIGRGAVVVLDDLVEALESGEIAGAGLDVFEIEPLPADHRLWSCANVVLTPHVAAASPRIAERHCETLIENVRRFVHGEPLINLVDKQRWF